MKRITAVAVTVCAIFFAASTASNAESNHRLGVGVNYWTAVEDIDIQNVDVDENGLSWLLTYQYNAGSILKLEADVELFKKGFAGSTENVYAPQAFILLGSSIYGGLGIGTYYSDGEWADSPFFALRAGLDLELLPMLRLDINANYRFNKWKNLVDVITEDISTDTVTLGAALRLQF
jgi:hypothetical protein